MSAAVRIRNALPSDRAAMLEITCDVWEGTDYVPFVWDQWLADVEGCTRVATIEGVPVGFQHLTVQPDGTCWLEGIRVAASVRGQGVARALLDDGVRWARMMQCTVARLSTSSGNPASNRMAERAGFQLLGTFLPLRAQGHMPMEVDGAVRVASPVDFDAVWDSLQRADYLDVARSFQSEGWTFYRATPQRVRLLLAMSAVLVVGTTCLQGLCVVTCAAPFRALRIGLLAGSESSMRQLCGSVLWRARSAGIRDVRAMIPDVRDVRLAAEEAGFSAPYYFAARLYECRLLERDSGTTGLDSPVP